MRLVMEDRCVGQVATINREELMEHVNTIEMETTSLPLRDPGHTALMVAVAEGPTLASNLRELVDRASPVGIGALEETGELRGKFKEFHILHIPPGAGPLRRIVLLGMGKPGSISYDTVRSAAAKTARTLRKLRCDTMLVDPSSFFGLEPYQVAQCVAEGIVLGIHRVHKRMKKPRREKGFRRLVLLCAQEESSRLLDGARRGVVAAEATIFARDVSNEPGVYLTPTDLASAAVDSGQLHGFEVEVFEEDRIEELGMGGIMAVGRGSDEPSRLILLRLKNEGAPRIALVGKGVTFDSGGVSLKPPKGMHKMKYDMGGAAAVLGAFQAAARLRIPLDLIGLIPSAENMPSGRSYKPGDVIAMHSGHHVEITNTDAEGRLLLADALSYAQELDPDCVIDLATLTGGCVIALGHIASGLMGTSEPLLSALLHAGKSVEEKLWRLPLYKEYNISLRSTVADVINSGGRAASAITAGCFLSRFVQKPWAHIDIAGTAWIEEDSMQYVHKPYLPKRGATGVGVRMLAAFLTNIAKQFDGDRGAFQAFLQGGE